MKMDFEVYLSPGYTPEDILALEDQAGIDKAVIMPQVRFGPDNEGLARAIKGYDRLLGCVCVNPNFGEEALGELRTAITDWGLKGLKLMAPVQAYNISSSIVYPLMDLARELEIPVTIHSGPSPAHPLEIAALVMRYPEVPVIMDHMGHRGYTEQAIRAAEICPNIYLGTTIAAFEPRGVKAAVDALGPERVVFGSNAPSAYPDLAMESIRRLKLGDEIEALIFGENLAKIYKLA